ncbi:MAG: hypothetical protein WCO77_03830, partial [bacterium]
MAWIMMGLMLLAIPGFAQKSDEIRQALRMAVADARQAMEASGLKKLGTISLLPIKNDQDNYFSGLLKNAISEAGLTYVEGKDDPFWSKVLEEVEWDERKN